jgi:phosphatidylinositol alpha-1,6-mannosyltransferase
MVQSYISHWDPEEVEVHFLPIFPSDDAEPFIGAEFHRLAENGPRSWKGLWTWLKTLRHSPLTRPYVYPLFAKYNASLSALIMRTGINVIYAHEVWPAGVAAVLQSRLHGVASVVTTYGEITKATPAYRRLQRTGKFVCNNADHISSCSQYCLDLALNLGADPTTSQSIPVGVDVERFRPGLDGSGWRRQHGITEDTTVVSVLGHVIHQKLDTFFDSIPHVQISGDVRFLVGGTGFDFDHFSDRAAEISNTSGVTVDMLGFVVEDELLEFYAATDIFVASPSTEIECLGLTLLEAMACGITVVAANIGGVPEFVRNGENGATFTADDPFDLARVLTNLVETPDLKDRLGSAGNVTAREEFDVRGMADTVLDIFREQVARRQKR